MLLALVRFCVGAKIPALGQNDKFFFPTLKNPPFPTNHNVVQIFFKQLFAFRDDLVISAAQQPSTLRQRLLGNSSMVERRTLTPLILVRVQVPQPNTFVKKISTLRVLADLALGDFMLRYVANQFP